ncbi:MAG: type II secretion system protein [Acidobacteria bacterium]|nr:type II secretion system protein [Acidobacteriota bacterium]
MRRVDEKRDLRRRACGAQADGFTLIEMLIALLILSFGLLSAGQLMYLAMGSASLARSKGNAAMVAQDKLEFLADVYRRNRADADLTVGDHGPEQVEILNPNSGTALNRFRIVWNVSTVPDPRAGKVLHARLVRVTVTPLGTGAAVNNQIGLNKTVSVSSIFSTRFQ